MVVIFGRWIFVMRSNILQIYFFVSCGVDLSGNKNIHSDCQHCMNCKIRSEIKIKLTIVIKKNQGSRKRRKQIWDLNWLYLHGSCQKMYHQRNWKRNILEKFIFSLQFDNFHHMLIFFRFLTFCSFICLMMMWIVDVVSFGKPNSFITCFSFYLLFCLCFCALCTLCLFVPQPSLPIIACLFTDICHWACLNK